MSRNKKVIRIGDKLLGGQNPILIQTMANVKTSKLEEILKMENDLSLLGNDLLRLSVLDEEDAQAFKVLSKKSKTPLIADIHFNYLFALEAIENGASAIRLNPGNISDKNHLSLVIAKAKEKHIPIRIGVNSGSLPSQFVSKRQEAEAYIQSLTGLVQLTESLGFTDLVLSVKSSDPEVTYQAYKLADEKFLYPLHIGVTEAGASYTGALRSAVALVPLLREGIGDTIRISLTEPPKDEVIAASQLLSALGLRKNVPTLVSCPTCGRTQVDLMKAYNRIYAELVYLKKDIKVAVMGCPVNGPGEAKDADIGLAGGVDSFLVFIKGKPVKSLKEDEAVAFVLDYIKRI
jgi:(E)-4-hydroxy-3-methylbut-2-enyl-diphosphate synthase